MSKSKKGPCWERKFAEILSLWWSNGKHTDIFYKTDGSGGRHTSRAKLGKRTIGQGADISCNDPVGQPLMDLLIIEAKRGYTSKTIQELFDRPVHRKQSMYEEWFTKAEKCAEFCGSFSWLFCVRRDWREAVLFMPFYFFEELTKELKKGGIMQNNELYATHGAYGGFDYFDIKGDRKRIAMLSWSLWEKIVTPDHIRALAKRC